MVFSSSVTMHVKIQIKHTIAVRLKKQATSFINPGLQYTCSVLNTVQKLGNSMLTRILYTYLPAYNKFIVLKKQ